MEEKINVVKFKCIKIDVPFFDPHPEKSTTGNHVWRQGLMVYFYDQEGKEFIWMPKWEDLKKINSGHQIVEETNREIYKNKCDLEKK